MDALKTVDDLLNVSPIKFQEMTMSLYRALGCQVWPRRIPGRPHLYVDIVTKDNKKSLAECRISLEDVDKDAVESFADLLKKEKAVDGAIITIVGLTEKARQAAKKKHIYLYGGSEFLGLWNSLHISDTTPRGPLPADAPVPVSESVVETPPPQPPQEMVVPASLAEVIPQAPPEQAHEAFLDQVQAEAELESKPARSREEIHRLFDSAPQPALSLDSIPPSAAEPPAEPVVFEPAPESEVPPEEVPANPEGQLSFFESTEPEEEVIPSSAEFLASLEGLAEPPSLTPEALLPESEFPATLEPMWAEPAPLPEETPLPSAEAELPPVGEATAPETPILPPVSDQPVPPVEAPVMQEITQPPVDPDNVIERLFGRGFEPEETTGRQAAPEAEEKIDFSIFQVPGVKLETKGEVVPPPTEPAAAPAADIAPESSSMETSPIEEAPEAFVETPVLEPAAVVETPAVQPEPPLLQAPMEAVTPPSEIPAMEVTPAEAAEEMPVDPAVVRSEAPTQPIPTPTKTPEPPIIIPDFLLPMDFNDATPRGESDAVKAAWQPLVAPVEAPVEATVEIPSETAVETPTETSVEASTEAPTEAAVESPLEPPAGIPPVAEIAPETPAVSGETIPTEMPPEEKVPEPPKGPSILVLHPETEAARGKGPDPDNLSICQAIERLEGDSPCLFVTGRPGTGRNLLLDHFIHSTNKNVVLLEPTPREAVEAEGQTLRSFFGFRDGVLGEADIHEVTDPAQKELYRHVDTLILDNIAHVSPNLVDAVDLFMRLNGREAGKPFGGAQLLLLGDLFQAAGPDHGVIDLLGEEYRSPFFFDAHAFQSLPMELVELKKEYDPRDETLTALLDAIRTNSLDETQYKLLNDRYIPDFIAPEETDYITLTSNSSVATKINKEHLRQLRSPECLHLAEIEGEFDETAWPAARELVLRRGAQVVFLKADYANKWARGTLGKVASISESTIQVEIDSDGFPFVFRVERETWQNFRYMYNAASGRIEKTMVGEFTQYPLRPGWAWTVQKSQGARFDHVVIDLSGEEADAGQLYAALCCCRKLDGLVLKDRISPRYKANTANRLQEIASLFI